VVARGELEKIINFEIKINTTQRRGNGLFREAGKEGDRLYSTFLYLF
jgi:hypothetical protein